MGRREKEEMRTFYSVGGSKRWQKWEDEELQKCTSTLTLTNLAKVELKKKRASFQTFVKSVF